MPARHILASGGRGEAFWRLVLDDDDAKAVIPPAWQWPGRWALNLPVMAVVWQALFARTFFIDLAAYHYFSTLGLVWLVIAGERWLFHFRLRPSILPQLGSAADMKEQREMMLRLAWIVALALTAVALFRYNSRETAGILILSSAGGGYLLAMARSSDTSAELLPRELVLSGLVTAAAVLFIWANTAFPPMRLLLPALLFLLLLFYYFCLIGQWSVSLLPAPQGVPLLQTSVGPLYRTLPLTMIFTGAAMALVTRTMAGDPLLLALGVSAILLLLLEYWAPKLSALQARLFADLALLTPLVPLLLLF